MIRNTKETLTSIWINKPTIYTIIFNVLIFLIVDTKYALMNLLYCLISSILAILIVNLIMNNIKKNNIDQYDKYFNWLPGTFCMFRFVIGLFATFIASSIQVYSPMDIITNNALAITFSWLVFPLTNTMIVASSIDYEIKTKNILKKWFLQIKYLCESVSGEFNTTNTKRRNVDLFGVLFLLTAAGIYIVYKIIEAIVLVVKMLK